MGVVVAPSERPWQLWPQEAVVLRPQLLQDLDRQSHHVSVASRTICCRYSLDQSIIDFDRRCVSLVLLEVSSKGALHVNVPQDLGFNREGKDEACPPRDQQSNAIFCPCSVPPTLGKDAERKAWWCLSELDMALTPRRAGALALNAHNSNCQYASVGL